MFSLAAFTTGLLAGTRGVFTLIVFEALACGFATVQFWGQGFSQACWMIAETAALVTAGFICTLIARYLLNKARPSALRQREESGILDIVANRDSERPKAGLTRFK